MVRTLNAKTEVLDLQWLKILKDLRRRHFKTKDPELQSFIERVEAIPEKVKFELFRFYINRANQKYKIAFFQWRLLDFKNNAQKEELVSNIMESYKRFMKDRPMNRWATDKTKKTSEVSQNFEIKYGFSLDSDKRYR